MNIHQYSYRKNQRGSALVISIVAIVALGLVMSSMVSILRSSLQAENTSLMRTQAKRLAESGARSVIWRFGAASHSASNEDMIQVMTDLSGKTFAFGEGTIRFTFRHNYMVAVKDVDARVAAPVSAGSMHSTYVDDVAIFAPLDISGIPTFGNALANHEVTSRYYSDHLIVGHHNFITDSLLPPHTLGGKYIQVYVNQNDLNNKYTGKSSVSLALSEHPNRPSNASLVMDDPIFIRKDGIIRQAAGFTTNESLRTRYEVDNTQKTITFSTGLKGNRIFQLLASFPRRGGSFRILEQPSELATSDNRGTYIDRGRLTYDRLESIATVSDPGEFPIEYSIANYMLTGIQTANPIPEIPPSRPIQNKLHTYFSLIPDPMILVTCTATVGKRDDGTPLASYTTTLRTDLVNDPDW